MRGSVVQMIFATCQILTAIKLLKSKIVSADLTIVVVK